MIQAVPTTIVTGFLGVGKTTAILDLLARRPAGARWAVLVNEFGQVGLDGAILPSEGGVVVREIAGGCVCCTAGPQLGVAINRLLREHRPDRLILEPTGLASPASILDLLRGPSYRTAVFVTPQQKAIAEASRAKWAARLKTGKMTTEILPVARFYPAEEEHRNYAKNNAVHYNIYRTGCGRDARLARVWGRPGEG